MAWTKRALIEMAYEEIGVSSALGYDLTSDQVALALNRLDAVMATLYQSGYRLGYNSPAEYKGGDPDDDSGIPNGANEAVYLSLAIRLAPTIGKMIAPQTKAAHRRAMNALAQYSDIPTVKRDTTAAPAGAGSTRDYRVTEPFLDPAYDDALSANLPGDLGEYSQ